MSVKKPIVLTILDGYGFSPKELGNAITQKNSPFITDLIKTHPHSLLEASGEAVGLPEGQIGNSEVGHLTMGAGRIIYTGLSLINKEIRTKEIHKNAVLLEAFANVKKYSSNLHIMGLLSPGGVHSHEEHIFELIKIANENGITPILHLFGDGRDVAPRSILESVEKLENLLKTQKAIIASVAGRFYAMDRDQRWERTHKAYLNLLGLEGNHFSSVSDYIKSQYKEDINDEFIEPGHNPKLSDFIIDDDSVIFANFRPDRARQLSHLFVGSELYSENPELKRRGIYFATMMNYDGIKPSGVLYPNVVPKNVLGDVLEENKKSQLRIAETEKYAHVTFFMDGGVEREYTNSKKILIPSPKVKTYDLKPEMSAVEITQKVIEVAKDYDFIILNYANADMVGHTGIFTKTEEAIEVVDEQVKILYEAISKIGGTLFITADHGNAEEMFDEKKQVITKHTINPVYFISSDKKMTLDEKGSLANIAPTLLEYAGIDIPKNMTAKSLLKKLAN